MPLRALVVFLRKENGSWVETGVSCFNALTGFGCISTQPLERQTAVSCILVLMPLRALVVFLHTMGDFKSGDDIKF